MPKYPLVIIKDFKRIFGPYDESNPKPQANVKLYFYVYRLVRLFYTCLYFYFMPFTVLAVPISYLIYQNDNPNVRVP